MRRSACIALLGVMLCAMIPAVSAPAGQISDVAFRRFTVEGGPVQVDIGGTGPVEWIGRVMVKGAGITLTADNGMKLWPTADWRDAERVEARGNVKVEGEYVAADKTTWSFVGKADAASYERTSGQGVMSGAVSFRAVNRITGAVVTAAADRMVYSFGTQQFRFERGDKPVHMEWQEPAPAAPAAPAAPKVGAAK
jgi:hypothetical protein